MRSSHYREGDASRDLHANLPVGNKKSRLEKHLQPAVNYLALMD